MKVFVTGATGFLGKSIVEELKKNGHQIVILVRNNNKLTDIHKETEIINGSLNDDISDKLINIDAVIHNAAKTPGADFNYARREETKKDFFESNVKGTKNLIQICKKNGIKKIIYISSHAVSNPIINDDYYTKSKHEAEILITQSSLDWKIIRPSGIYGINDYWIQLLNYYKEKKILILPGNGKVIIDYIYVNDLAAQIYNLLVNNESIHQKYLAAGERISYYDFLKLIKEIFQYKLVILNIPLWIIKIFVDIFGVFNKRLIYKFNNIKSQYNTIDEKNIMDFIILKTEYNHRKALIHMKK